MNEKYNEFDELIDYDFDLEEDFEGNDLPYTLEHIDGEQLYREDINDTSDDYYLQLMSGNIKRIR